MVGLGCGDGCELRQYTLLLIRALIVIIMRFMKRMMKAKRFLFIYIVCVQLHLFGDSVSRISVWRESNWSVHVKWNQARGEAYAGHLWTSSIFDGDAQTQRVAWRTYKEWNDWLSGFGELYGVSIRLINFQNHQKGQVWRSFHIDSYIHLLCGVHHSGWAEPVC